jgi:hypothetical protein
MDQYSNHIISGDTKQTAVVLNQLFEDNEREIPLDRLKLPKSLPNFTLLDILTIADKIEDGEIDDRLVVNEDYMIVKGLKRFYALKRLRRTRVRVCINCNKKPGAGELFSIRK